MYYLDESIESLKNCCIKYLALVDKENNYISSALTHIEEGTLSDSGVLNLRSYFERLNNDLDKYANKLCRKMRLNYDKCLQCSDEKIVKCISIVFTYLSKNSNIMLTTFIDERLNLQQLQEAMRNYLLTGDNSWLSITRLQLADFVQTYKRPFKLW